MAAMYEIEGGRELRRGLKAAGFDLKELKAVHKDVSQFVSKQAYDRAPVRSGKLARNIRAGATQKAAIVRAGGKRVPYANPIHWGWFKRHIKPNMFVQRAGVENEARWKRIYEQQLDKAFSNF